MCFCRYVLKIPFAYLSSVAYTFHMEIPSFIQDSPQIKYFVFYSLY